MHLLKTHTVLYEELLSENVVALSCVNLVSLHGASKNSLPCLFPVRVAHRDILYKTGGHPYCLCTWQIGSVAAHAHQHLSAGSCWCRIAAGLWLVPSPSLEPFLSFYNTGVRWMFSPVRRLLSTVGYSIIKAEGTERMTWTSVCCVDSGLSSRSTVLVQATVTEYTGGLKIQAFISHSSGGWMSKISVQAFWGSGENSLPGLQIAAFLMSHGRER